MAFEKRDPKKNDRKEGGMPTKRLFFKRSKGCPFENKNAAPIDYKDVKVLQRYVSERGKIMPRRISNVSSENQRKLALAVKRARFLGFMPYSDQ